MCRRKQGSEWSWRQFFTGMVGVIPFIILTDVTGADAWPFWQYLLLAVAVGGLIGLAMRLAQTLTMRRKYGVWSWRPIQPDDVEREA